MVAVVKNNSFNYNATFPVGHANGGAVSDARQCNCSTIPLTVKVLKIIIKAKKKNI